MTETQVALTRARSPDEYRDVLASNAEEYERLARMVGDMLFLAQAEHGLLVPSREPVDLANEVRELFDFFEALAEEKSLRLSLTGSGQVSGDKLMLRRGAGQPDLERHSPYAAGRQHPAFASRRRTAARPSPSRIPASRSRRNICRESSTASTVPTRRDTTATKAPASASPSPVPSSRRTAARFPCARRTMVPASRSSWPAERIGSATRRVAIRSGEESVFCSTALLRRGFTSADF